MNLQLSKAAAVEVARKHCDDVGLPFVEPIHVRRGLYAIRVRTKSDAIGGNVVIVISTWSGRVLSVSTSPK